MQQEIFLLIDVFVISRYKHGFILEAAEIARFSHISDYCTDSDGGHITRHYMFFTPSLPIHIRTVEHVFHLFLLPPHYSLASTYNPSFLTHSVTRGVTIRLTSPHSSPCTACLNLVELNASTSSLFIPPKNSIRSAHSFFSPALSKRCVNVLMQAPYPAAASSPAQGASETRLLTRRRVACENKAERGGRLLAG